MGRQDSDKRDLPAMQDDVKQKPRNVGMSKGTGSDTKGGSGRQHKDETRGAEQQAKTRRGYTDNINHDGTDTGGYQDETGTGGRRQQEGGGGANGPEDQPQYINSEVLMEPIYI